MSDRRPDRDHPYLEALLGAALRDASGRCPDAGELVGAEDAPASGRLAAHAAGCPRCYSLLDGLRAPERPLPRGPRGDRMLARARNVKDAEAGATSPEEAASEGWLRLVARVVGERLHLVEATGRALVPATVRGPEDDGVGVQRRLGDLYLQAHLSFSRSGGFGILLDVLRAHADDEPLRVTLRRDARELRSETWTGSRPVLFSNVRPGRYRIDLSSGERARGSLDLDLEDP